MGRLGKWFALYCSIGFIVLIPVMSYHVITQHLPKKILLIVLPLYALLAWSSFTFYKSARSK